MKPGGDRSAKDRYRGERLGIRREGPGDRQSGQLARAIRDETLASKGEVEFVGRPELDLHKPGSATAAIARARPDCIINAAAYTAVDLGGAGARTCLRNQ